MTQDAVDVRLPPFYCPIAPAKTPLTESAEHHSKRWMERVLADLGGARLDWAHSSHAHEFFGRCATMACEPEVFYQGVYFHYLTFTFDDVCDAERHGEKGDKLVRFTDLANRFMRAIEIPGYRPPEGTDPFVAAAGDIAAELRRHVSPAQMGHFVDGVRSYVLGCVWHLTNEQQGIIPAVDDYLSVRLLECGGRFVVALAAMADGLDIPMERLQSSPVRAVTECTTLIAALDNDLVSHRKEGTYDQNQDIITVLRAHHGYDLADGVDAAVRLRDRMMSLFLRLQRQLVQTGDAALRTYVIELGQIISGNIEWSLHVPRYDLAADLSGPYLSLAPEPWTDRPSDPDPAPLPYPSVAWWWDQLD
ncbi:hypothetical protein EF847_14995 [Actinobacteria bacterium YIM 96077]|uniref:Terpene synthase n=1 Tax=Phytoactinopolyspora halophila TaxID=1981511 RepID=A0A329QTJ9_9ACTN|nr:terpene synthase family protein [Phytoactinopolyspora halophila]AYY13809.1 hypothetical protein EF847_14995 [Actinobacteria bacterium YIM 96077]RAW15647.1 hypothetical protein DPM12_08345 [Phytoactinopolyspora halophila]